MSVFCAVLRFFPKKGGGGILISSNGLEGKYEAEELRRVEVEGLLPVSGSEVVLGEGIPWTFIMDIARLGGRDFRTAFEDFLGRIGGLIGIVASSTSAEGRGPSKLTFSRLDLDFRCL